jgi:hypothetical protein
MDWSSVSNFFSFGLHHVLEGWDHLLFASALVLALTGFWEVFKVVGVFTIAHSITVTITALHGSRVVPAQYVEPAIAGSIIFVAIENIVRKDSKLSRRRLVVAFLFGLVHGLGFGGALTDGLRELPGGTVGWAIAAFCVGVETGHLCVVAPLSGALKIGRDAGGESFRRLALLWGSVLIALAGCYYLYAAIKSGGAE